MNKFRKGNFIVAGKQNPNTGDRSFLGHPVCILHVAPKHWVVKGQYGNSMIAFDEAKDMDFHKATKKTIEIMMPTKGAD